MAVSNLGTNAPNGTVGVSGFMRNSESTRYAPGIVEEGKKDMGTSNCPLCGLFHIRCTPIKINKCCEGCPVMERTGESGCFNTPYKKYIITIDKHRRSHPLAIEAAKEELEFLRSLLPEGEK